LWRGVTKTNEKYFYGSIELIAGIKQKIVVFKNKPKSIYAKAPAYNIYITEDNDNKENKDNKSGSTKTTQKQEVEVKIQD